MSNCPWCSEELTTREHVCSGTFAQFAKPSTRGWSCPNCGRGLSPFINECPCYLLNKGMGLPQKGDPDGA